MAKSSNHCRSSTAGGRLLLIARSAGRARVVAGGQPLLAAAQQACEIRDDLTLDQVLDLIHAIATIPGDTSYVQAILQAALDGLRPSTDGKPSPEGSNP